MPIRARVDEIRGRMENACRRAGRSPGSVVLVAVTKTRSIEEVESVIESGIHDLGENRVQEGDAKREALGAVTARWHLVGHLQKNNAKRAVQIFNRIHSLDSVELGGRLDQIAREQSKVQPVLVQVDLAGEETKFGIPETGLLPALESLLTLPNLRVDGLMILPPYLPDPEQVRPFFRRARELSEEARSSGLTLGNELSMGMSHDFEVAIEEGATFVRLGTALFGPRPNPVATASSETASFPGRRQP
jgi:pyridoxal phosphate enzyme (YggS family)